MQVIEERNLNPWMMYHMYSVYHTPEIGLRIMKLSLIIASLQFYVLMNCIFFGYEKPHYTLVILFIILSMACTWIFNYIWGFVSIMFRQEKYGKNGIHPLYWLLFFIVFMGLSVGSIISAFKESKE